MSAAAILDLGKIPSKVNPELQSERNCSSLTPYISEITAIVDGGRNNTEKRRQIGKIPYTGFPVYDAISDHKS